MTTKDFIDENIAFINSVNSVPYVSYGVDSWFEKTRFGVKKAADYTGQIDDLDNLLAAKLALKNSKIKLRKGDTFVLHRNDVGWEIIPGYGLVLGNELAAQGDAEFIDYVLEQKNVKAIFWHNEATGEKIYIEAPKAS